LEKDSISVIAKRKSRDEVFLSMLLQMHWFAVSLYEVFTKFIETTSDGSDTSSEEFEGQQHTLNLKVLNNSSGIIKKCCTLET